MDIPLHLNDLVKDINVIGYWFQKMDANNIIPFTVTTLLFNFKYNHNHNYNKHCTIINNGSIKSFNPKYNTFYKLFVLKDLATAICNLQSNNLNLKVISQVVIKSPDKIKQFMI